jgi:P-type Cu2+ transporter
MYNAVAIPVAVLGHGSPLMAAAVMALSSIPVVMKVVRQRIS